MKSEPMKNQFTREIDQLKQVSNSHLKFDWIAKNVLNVIKAECILRFSSTVFLEGAAKSSLRWSR